MASLWLLCCLLPHLALPMAVQEYQDDGSLNHNDVEETSTPDIRPYNVEENYPRANIDDFNAEEEPFEQTNPDFVDGHRLFEKDIMLTEDQWRAVLARKGLANEARRWPEDASGTPRVKYRFADANVNQGAVNAAIEHWESHTCIRFDLISDIDQPHLMFRQLSGCWSYIGYLAQYFPNGQNVSIGLGCNSLGTVVHEIGHSLGYYHEQSRPDRDLYVHVNTDNINPSSLSNFDKKSESVINNQGVPYDLRSVMQYGGKYFSINEHLTLATVDPRDQELIGRRVGLTHRDVLLANRMYHCIDKWLAACGLDADPCKNDGFTGSSCSCVCPVGTSGANCENVIGDYHDPYRSSCNELITSPKTISSPNYPSNYPSGVTCAKWIRAPANNIPKITFKFFELTECSRGRDYLEIRTDNPYDGNYYCGTEIAPGTTFQGTAENLTVLFYTKTSAGVGWEAEVTFFDPSATTTTTPELTTTTTTSTTTTTTTTEPPTTTTTTEPPTTTTTTEPPTTTTTTEPSTTTTTTTTEPPTTSTTTTEPPTTTTTTTTTEPPTTTATTTEPPTTTTTTETPTTTTTTTTTTEPSTTTTTTTTEPPTTTTTTETPTTTTTTTTTEPPTTTTTTTEPPTTTTTTTTTTEPPTTTTTTETPTTTITTTTTTEPSTTTTTTTTEPPTTTTTTTTEPPTTTTTTTKPPTTTTPPPPTTTTKLPSTTPEPITTTTPEPITTTTPEPTTTATTPIVTTTPESSSCAMQHFSGRLDWLSPNFGYGNYPNDFSCGIVASYDGPLMAKYTFNTFNLEKSWSGRCYDYVDIQIPYDRNTRLCGSQAGYLNVPNFRFTTNFVTDSSITDVGFNISISWSKTACHRTIRLSESHSEGVISSPNYPGDYPEQAACEWWIVAPAGRKVALQFNEVRIKKPDCQKFYIVVDKSGTGAYHPDDSALICSGRNHHYTSNAETMNVAFFGRAMRRARFFATYTLV